MALPYCEVQNALDVSSDDPPDEGLRRRYRAGDGPHTCHRVYKKDRMLPFFFFLLPGFVGSRPMQGGGNAVQFSLFGIPGAGVPETLTSRQFKCYPSTWGFLNPAPHIFFFLRHSWHPKPSPTLATQCIEISIVSVMSETALSAELDNSRKHSHSIYFRC